MLLNILFFFSGFSALIYEITWSRKLTLVFGNDSYGVATILAVFFSGLALGSFLYSKFLRNKPSLFKKPLLNYALLEGLTGLFALLSPSIFKLIGLLQLFLFRILPPSFGSFNLITLLLSFLALIIPCTLMGATLPAIISATDNKKAGILYGVNTFGALLGTLFSGFLLIPSFGINLTIFLAGFINLAVAFFAFKNSSKLKIEYKNPSSQSSKLVNNSGLLLLLSYFLAGFSAMGLEILFTRFIILNIGGSIYSFTLVLAVFLAGIAFGSLLSSWFFKKTKNSLNLYAITQFMLGLILILLLYFLSELPLHFLSLYKIFAENFLSLQLGLALLISAVLLLPTLLMGIAFPLAVSAFSQNAADTGILYSLNTIGGVLGALITGFFLIQRFGTAYSLLLLSSLYLLIGIIFIFQTGINIYMKILPVLLFFLLLFIGISSSNWNIKLFSSGIYIDPDEFKGLSKKEILKKVNRSPVLFTKEGTSSLVTVKKDTDGNVNMQINGKTDASTGSDMETQVMLGQLPLLIYKNPEPEQALVVGLGSGITLGSILSHPVKSVDVVEIEKEVGNAANLFSKYNNNALKDPRTHLIIADGRHFLKTVDHKYDVISSEPSNPWQSGSSKLFTREYFQELKDAAKKDGIVVHWVNMYAIGIKGLKSVIKAYTEVFPEVKAFGIPVSNDLVLIGSNSKISINGKIIEEKMALKSVKDDLEKASINEKFEILARFYLDKKALEKISRDTAANTDDFPYLEFSAPEKLYFSVSEDPWRILFDNFSPISEVAGNTASEELQKAEEFRRVSILNRIAFIEKNVGNGMKYAQNGLELDPDNPNLKASLAQFHFEDANTYFKDKNYIKAAEAYEKSISYHPTAEAYYNLGQSYEDDDPDKAENAYEKALAIDPDFTEALDKLADIYGKNGDIEKAGETLIRLDRLEPENADTKATLAELYYLKKDFGKAEIYAKQSLKIDGKNETAKEILDKIP